MSDCLVVFAAHCLLPSGGPVALPANVRAVCFTTSVFRPRPAWLMAGVTNEGPADDPSPKALVAV